MHILVVCSISQGYIILSLFLLSGADLSDADLRGADFSLANVTKVVSVNLFIKNSEFLAYIYMFNYFLANKIVSSEIRQFYSRLFSNLGSNKFSVVVNSKFVISYNYHRD